MPQRHSRSNLVKREAGRAAAPGNTEGPRERARHHWGLALALRLRRGLRLGTFAPEVISHHTQHRTIIRAITLSGSPRRYHRGVGKYRNKEGTTLTGELQRTVMGL